MQRCGVAKQECVIVMQECGAAKWLARLPALRQVLGSISSTVMRRTKQSGVYYCVVKEETHYYLQNKKIYYLGNTVCIFYLSEQLFLSFCLFVCPGYA
jgi:hypothetical protein